MSQEAQLVVDCHNLLGEGLCHDAQRDCLWWVQIEHPSTLYQLDYDSDDIRTWQFDTKISYAVPRASGGLLVAAAAGLHHFDPDTGKLKLLKEIEPDRPANRSNDSCCDPQGRLWVGTMLDDFDNQPAEMDKNCGALYRIAADLTITRMLDKLSIPNAQCYAPDGRTMYFSDTLSGIIWAYDFDAASGSLANQREFATHSRGLPDGATVDLEGGVWSARYGGGCVIRFAPDGSFDRLVEVPCSNITCCTFGGAKLDTLYITSATNGLEDDLLAEQPQAGGLFAVQTGVCGTADVAFAD